MDGEVITYNFDGKKARIIYLDENEFKKKMRAVKRYSMNAYKYWIFDVIPKLKIEGKKDGKYELQLPVNEIFQKVYGEVKILLSVQNDVVILEDITPSDMLMEMHNKDLPTYKGVPYRNNKDKFKIDFYKEVKKNV